MLQGVNTLYFCMLSIRMYSNASKKCWALCSSQPPQGLKIGKECQMELSLQLKDLVSFLNICHLHLVVNVMLMHSDIVT